MAVGRESKAAMVPFYLDSSTDDKRNTCDISTEYDSDASTTPLEHGKTWSCGMRVSSGMIVVSVDSWQMVGEESANKDGDLPIAASSEMSTAMDVNKASMVQKKQKEIQQKIGLADMAWQNMELHYEREL